jgi:predicted RNase H-like HicB family nuclease
MLKTYPCQEEIPGANAQEETKEELLISLKEAVTDIIELRRQQARSEMENDYEEVLLAI